jgi:hypothetical protein
LAHDENLLRFEEALIAYDGFAASLLVAGRCLALSAVRSNGATHGVARSQFAAREFKHEREVFLRSFQTRTRCACIAAMRGHEPVCRGAMHNSALMLLQ